MISLRRWQNSSAFALIIIFGNLFYLQLTSSTFLFAENVSGALQTFLFSVRQRKPRACLRIQSPTTVGIPFQMFLFDGKLLLRHNFWNCFISTLKVLRKCLTLKARTLAHICKNNHNSLNTYWFWQRMCSRLSRSMLDSQNVQIYYANIFHKNIIRLIITRIPLSATALALNHFHSRFIEEPFIFPKYGAFNNSGKCRRFG